MLARILYTALALSLLGALPDASARRATGNGVAVEPTRALVAPTPRTVAVDAPRLLPRPASSGVR